MKVLSLAVFNKFIVQVLYIYDAHNYLQFCKIISNVHINACCDDILNSE